MSLRQTLAVLLLAASGCESDWRTDMWYQPSHRPEDSPRPEPKYSVQLGAGPFVADRDDATDLQNPTRRDVLSVGRGEAIFHDRCSACHGAQGHGGGPVSKFFPPAPDLAYVTVKQRSDGYIFGTITFGGPAMPPLGEGLTAGDRWDVVNFVRTIQGAPVPGAQR